MLPVLYKTFKDLAPATRTHSEWNDLFVKCETEQKLSTVSKILRLIKCSKSVYQNKMQSVIKLISVISLTGVNSASADGKELNYEIVRNSGKVID